MKGKFKKLRPHADEIMDDYLHHDMNMSEIAEKHGVHYSNLRRFIKAQIRERGLEETFDVQYVNVSDFHWLDIGDTFQYADWMKVWRVTKITEKENDQVFELVPSPTKNRQRHWINDEPVGDKLYEAQSH